MKRPTRYRPYNHTPAPPPESVTHPLRAAVRLYGTLPAAVSAIRRHLDTQGPDLDPNVRKRAERLLALAETPVHVDEANRVPNTWEHKLLDELLGDWQQGGAGWRASCRITAEALVRAIDLGVTVHQPEPVTP